MLHNYYCEDLKSCILNVSTEQSPKPVQCNLLSHILFKLMSELASRMTASVVQLSEFVATRPQSWCGSPNYRILRTCRSQWSRGLRYVLPFARPKIGIVGSNLCVFVFTCVGSGLASGWSPAQRVLPSVYGIKKVENSEGPAKGSIVIIIIILEFPTL
jgi:hypothetical protein